MIIKKYKFSNENFNFSEVEFSKLNLLVGDSGAGKTRLLNTIFNIGSFVAQSKIEGAGNWSIDAEIQGKNYHWEGIVEKDEVIYKVIFEKLTINGKEIIIRNDNNTNFLDKQIIKLPQDILSISVLREEPDIEPLYKSFTKIIRRRFFSDEQDKNSKVYLINQNILRKIGETHDLYQVFTNDIPLNSKLQLLSEFFPDIYSKIIDSFLEIFTYVEKVNFLEGAYFLNIFIPDDAKVFCIKESNIDKWIGIDQLSSGMQKTLLILTDLFSLPDDSVYLIDEYENSLGISPLNVLSEIIMQSEYNSQVFITSHHPYIINKFPIDTWFVVHRNGKDITFDYGKTLSKRYEGSSQEKYIQLLNDPNYNEGIK